MGFTECKTITLYSSMNGKVPFKKKTFCTFVTDKDNEVLHKNNVRTNEGAKYGNEGYGNENIVIKAW